MEPRLSSYMPDRTMEGDLHMKKVLLLILGILILTGLVNAGDLGAGNSTYYTCYQETANVSTTCGGLDTGGYLANAPTLAFNINNSYDGDWNSFGYFTGLAVGQINISYSVPNYAKNVSGNIWQVRRLLNGTFMNLTIPQDCLKSDRLNFSLTGTSVYLGTFNRNNYTCYNYTSNQYVQIFEYTGVDSNGIIAYLYEEGMFWSRSYFKLYEYNQSYNNNTIETKQETFSINISYDDINYPVINANLVYNGTSYAATKTGSNTNYTFTKTLNIPLINSTQENRSFYWEISITNTTSTYYYNSSWQNQTIKQINFGECGDKNNNTVLNFTAYDQITGSMLSNWNFKGIINYFSNSGTLSRNVSFNNLSINSKALCIDENITFNLTGQIEYSKTDYTTSNYYLINFPVYNQTQNISLYLLNSSETTPFIMVVQSQNQLPLLGYYVYVYRYDAFTSAPSIVQISQTDSSGQTVGFFQTYTVDYLFKIADTTGKIIYTSEKRKMIPTTTPYTIYFTVGNIIPDPYAYLSNLTGITYVLGYNLATEQASVQYTDSNTSFQYANLLILAQNMSGPNKVICNVSSLGASAVLVCDMTGNLSGTYKSEFYTTRAGTTTFVDSLFFTIEGMSSITGMLGLLGAFFIMLIFCFAFFYNEVAGIISINVGLWFNEIIGFTHFGVIFCSAILGVSILILIVFERG